MSILDRRGRIRSLESGRRTVRNLDREIREFRGGRFRKSRTSRDELALPAPSSSRRESPKRWYGVFPSDAFLGLQRGSVLLTNLGKSPIRPRNRARTGKTLRTKNVGLGELLRVPEVRRRSEPPAGRWSRITDLEKPEAWRVFISSQVHAPSEKTRKNLRAIPSNSENRSDRIFFSGRS